MGDRDGTMLGAGEGIAVGEPVGSEGSVMLFCENATTEMPIANRAIVHYVKS